MFYLTETEISVHPQLNRESQTKAGERKRAGKEKVKVRKQINVFTLEQA